MLHGRFSCALLMVRSLARGWQTDRIVRSRHVAVAVCYVHEESTICRAMVNLLARLAARLLQLTRIADRCRYLIWRSRANLAVEDFEDIRCSRVVTTAVKYQYAVYLTSTV